MKRKGQDIEEIIEREFKKGKTLNENFQPSSHPKYFNELSKEICYSFILDLNCYICDGKISNLEDSVNCFYCSKLYHESCHSKSDFFENKCKFCVNSENNYCVICSQNDEKSFKVYCEFCGNIMHYLCLNIPLRVLVDRLIYKYFPEEFIKYLRNTKEFGSFFEVSQIKEERIKEISNIYGIIPPVIFNICPLCAKKEEEKDLYIYNCQLFQGRVYFKVQNKRKSKIHEFYHYQQKLVKNEMNNNELSEVELTNSIIEKYSTNQFNDSSISYYLIKWKQNHEVKYTLEHSLFVENVQYFKKSLPLFYSERLKITEKLNYALNKPSIFTAEKLSSIREKLISKLKEYFIFKNIENDKTLLLSFLDRFYENFLKRNFYIPFYFEQTNFFKEQLILNLIAEFKENKKFIICIDNNEEKKFWKSILELNKIKFKVLSNSYKYLKLIAEILFIDYNKVKFNIQSLIDIFSKENNSSSNDNFLKIIENITLTFNIFKFEVLLIDIALFIQDFSFLNKFELDFILFDLTKFDSIRELEKLIKLSSNKIIILQKHMKKFNEYNTDLPLNIDAFCQFFTKNVVFTNSTSLKIFNKTCIFINEFSYNNYMNSLNWDILIPNNINVNTNIPTYIKYTETQNKVMFLFVPIIPCLKDIIVYWKIIEQIKDKIFVKNLENKIELIINLLSFCNFPKKITYPHIIKEAKYSYEINYSKSKSFLNTLNQIKQRHGYHSKINIIFINSSGSIDDKVSYNSLLNEVMKSKISNTYVYFLEDFPFNEATEDYIYLLMNVNCFSKKYSDLFCYFIRKLNHIKTSICVYQMFLKYTIEENCLDLLYKTHIESMFKKETLFQILSKDEKENLIKNNIYYLKKFYIKGKEIMITEDNLPQINDDCEIVTVLKNSLFFLYNLYKNRFSTIDNKWEEILDFQNLDIVSEIDLKENINIIVNNDEALTEKRNESSNPLFKHNKKIIEDEDKIIPRNFGNDIGKNNKERKEIVVKLPVVDTCSKIIRQDSFQLLLNKVSKANRNYMDIENISLKILSKKNIIDRIKVLEESDYNINELLGIINFSFISFGYTSIVFNKIIGYIFMWGINFNKIEKFIEQVLMYINSELEKKFEKTDIELFISIISFILNHNNHPKIKDSIKLFIDKEFNINKLKKVILSIEMIRKFLELPLELIQNQLKSLLLEGKIKKCNSNNVIQYSILSLNMLKCVIEIGYGNYYDYLDSNILREGFTKYKDFHVFIDSLLNEKTSNKKEKIADELEDFFNQLEERLINSKSHL